MKVNILDKRGKDTELNQFKISVCDNQGLLFQECQWDFEVDAKDFITKFMGSNVAADMDNTVSPYHNTGILQIGTSILRQCKIIEFSGEYINSDVLYWMGYIYRYWVWWLGDLSGEVYKIADFDLMLKNYKYLHTLSPELAIIKLKNSKGEISN